MRWLAVTAVAVAPAFGCSHPRRGTAIASGDPSADGSPLAIAVENHNSADVVVTLVVQNGPHRRLGTVGGNVTAAFGVPSAVLGGTRRVVLVAHAIGGRGSYTSEVVTVSGGRRAVWTLENGFARSVLAVY